MKWVSTQVKRYCPTITGFKYHIYPIETENLYHVFPTVFRANIAEFYSALGLVFVMIVVSGSGEALLRAVNY